MNKIAIFTHTQYKNGSPVPGPADSILEYLVLNPNYKVLFLRHSLYKGAGTQLTEYIGKEYKSLSGYTFQKNLPEPARYIIDILGGFTALVFKEKQRMIIAADPLNFLSAYFLKLVGKADIIVYYSLDYAFQRFPNKTLNNIYHALDKFAARKCDYTFGACRKICDIRTKDGVPAKKNLYLPNSPVLEGVDVKGIDSVNRHSLVMVFSDYTQIDFTIIFNALKELKSKYPDILIKIIGRGNFAENVTKLVTSQDLLKHIKFLDTKTHAETLSELSTSALGLECNNQTVAWNEFREPIKIREYIALGLPVITKRGHALIEEIQEQNIGRVIETSEDLVAAVSYYFDNPQVYESTRTKEIEYAKQFSKEQILNSFFEGNI